MDHLSQLDARELRSFSDWKEAISKNIPTENMLNWFGSTLDEMLNSGELKPWTLNQWLAAQHRFRELAHFSKKLSPEQRQTFIDQADMILSLARDFYGEDKEKMARLDAAISYSAEFHKRFGWPNALWDVLDFEEL